MSLLKELKVPAFKAGGQPEVDLRTYSLSIGGLVEEERHFSWAELLAMPMSVVNCRLTSVSGWSVRADWEGIVWRDFIKKVSVLSESDHARFTSIGGGYTTVVSLKDLQEPRVLLAIKVNGEPIESEYGGPLRSNGWRILGGQGISPLRHHRTRFYF
jgi:DMSO/TMAO reductase YedYZ molybdopterin-dependent catalytic subunit